MKPIGKVVLLFLILLSIPLFLAYSFQVQNVGKEAKIKRSVKQVKSKKTFLNRLGAKTPIYKKNEVIVKFYANILDQNAKLDIKDVFNKQTNKTKLKNKDIKANVQKNFTDLQQYLTSIKTNNLSSIFSNKLADRRLQDVYLIKFQENADSLKVAGKLEQNPLVEYAEPNYQYYFFEQPNDPYYQDSYPNNTSSRDPIWNPKYDYQWNLKQIELDKVFDKKIKFAKATVVAVIDSGIDYTHEDFGSCTLDQLKNNRCPSILPGFDFGDNDDNPMDTKGHGTHVSGIITSTINNGKGGASFNHQIKILPLKAANAAGSLYQDKISQSIEEAIRQKANVINMSFGTWHNPARLMGDILQVAYENNIVLVAATGNDNDLVEGSFPAEYICQDNSGQRIDCVLSVGASNTQGETADFSNKGRGLDIIAPGGNDEDKENNHLNIIAPKSSAMNDTEYRQYNLVINDKYLRLAGTSMASPHVAAAAALVKAVNPALTNIQVRNILLNSATDLGKKGYDLAHGYGLLNINEALQNPKPGRLNTLELMFPEEGLPVANKFSVWGAVDLIDLSSYEIFIAPENDRQNFSASGVSLMGGGKSAIVSNILAHVDMSERSEGKYILKIVATTKDKVFETEDSFLYDRRVKAGWPFFDKNSSKYKETEPIYPAIADVNNDPKKEIALFFPHGRSWTLLDSSPNVVDGWPVSFDYETREDKYPVGNPYAYLGIAPINSNNCSSGICNKNIFNLWNGVKYGGTYLESRNSQGQKTAISSNVIGDALYTARTPILDDLDNDGNTEMIVLESERWETHWDFFVVIRNSNGEVIKKTFLPFSAIWKPGQGPGWLFSEDWKHNKIVVGNIDTTPEKEIIIGYGLPGKSFGTNNPQPVIIALKPDGRLIHGWDPKAVPWFYINNLLAADFNNDDQAEIVFATKENYYANYVIKAIGYDGKEVFKYDTQSVYPIDLQLFDADASGTPDVFINYSGADRGLMKVVDTNGNLIAEGFDPDALDISDSWKRAELAVETGSNIVIGDVDGDRYKEIIKVDVNGENKYSAKIFKVKDGVISSSGNPIALNKYYGGQMNLADIDIDGIAELILPNYSSYKMYLYAYNMSSDKSTGVIDLPQVNYNERNTRYYQAAKRQEPKLNICQPLNGDCSTLTCCPGLYCKNDPTKGKICQLQSPKPTKTPTPTVPPADLSCRLINADKDIISYEYDIECKDRCPVEHPGYYCTNTNCVPPICSIDGLGFFFFDFTDGPLGSSYISRKNGCPITNVESCPDGFSCKYSEKEVVLTLNKEIDRQLFAVDWRIGKDCPCQDNIYKGEIRGEYFVANFCKKSAGGQLNIYDVMKVGNSIVCNFSEMSCSIVKEIPPTRTPTITQPQSRVPRGCKVDCTCDKPAVCQKHPSCIQTGGICRLIENKGYCCQDN